MEELAITGIVIMYLLLIASQHLLNWGFRNRDKDFPIVLVFFGQIVSLVFFLALTLKVVILF